MAPDSGNHDSAAEVAGMPYREALVACGQGNAWESALRLLGDMRQHRYEPDRVGHSAAIAACAQGGRWAEVLCLLDGLRGFPESLDHEVCLGLDAPTLARADAINVSNVEHVSWQQHTPMQNGGYPGDSWPGVEEDLQSNGEADARLADSFADCVDAWRRAMELMGRPGLSSFVGMRDSMYGNAVSSSSTVSQVSARHTTRENGNSDNGPDVVAISESVLRHGRAGDWEMALNLLKSIVPEADFQSITRHHSDNGVADSEDSGRWETAYQMLHSLVNGNGSELPHMRSTMGAAATCTRRSSQWARVLSLLEGSTRSTPRSAAID